MNQTSGEFRGLVNTLNSMCSSNCFSNHVPQTVFLRLSLQPCSSVFLELFLKPCLSNCSSNCVPQTVPQTVFLSVPYNVHRTVVLIVCPCWFDVMWWCNSVELEVRRTFLSFWVGIPSWGCFRSGITIYHWSLNLRHQNSSSSSIIDCGEHGEHFPTQNNKNLFKKMFNFPNKVLVSFLSVWRSCTEEAFPGGNLQTTAPELHQKTLERNSWNHGLGEMSSGIMENPWNTLRCKILSWILYMLQGCSAAGGPEASVKINGFINSTHQRDMSS